MKYDILQDFKGSQDGRFTEQFTAGTQADLSDYLASVAPAGCIRLTGEIENKAVITEGKARTRISRK